MFWRVLLSCLWLFPSLAHANSESTNSESAKTSPKGASKTITIVADEWCPYNCTPGSERLGFMIEIAKKIFENNGYSVVYKTMPWDEAVEKTRSGEFHAIIGASQNDAPDFIFPTIEQGWMQTQFYVAKSNKWRYLGKDSLPQITLGVAAGYSYGVAVDGYIKSHRNDRSRVRVASGENVLEQNVNALLAGSVGAILEDMHVMNYYLSNNKLSDKIVSGGRLPISDANNIYIAFSPKKAASKRYARIVEEGMDEMRKNKELAVILSRYSITDWRQ